MSLITRFLTSFTGEDKGAAEKPGLVEDQTGSIYLIKQDGTRVLLGDGGGGSLPASWSDGGHGDVSIATDDPTLTPLQLRPPVNATQRATDQLEWYDDVGNLMGWIDAAGNISADGPGGGTGVTFTFAPGTPGNPGSATLSTVECDLNVATSFTYSHSGFTGSGINVRLDERGGTPVFVVGRTSFASDKLLIQATWEDKIGFFGATPVAQPTGVAVSAAGIHAALVALGLITA